MLWALLHWGPEQGRGETLCVVDDSDAHLLGGVIMGCSCFPSSSTEGTLDPAFELGGGSAVSFLSWGIA
jgi:hypothetical protein